ncbi:MAG TPA: methylated-DNA--[protein]-cysteine S-methyltransferase [Thermoanaerobaculia bacterium]
MRCRSALTRIDAMRTGELPAPESSAVHQHLKTCQSCDESVSDLSALTASLKELVVPPPRSLRATCTDHFDVIDADGEQVLVAFSDRGLRMIKIGESPDEFRAQYRQRFGRELVPASLPERLRKQVVAALSGEGVDKPVVDFTDAGELERKVLDILTHIPRGEVRTYTWVARQAGNPKAVRAVGNICARNVVPFVIPCHRVVPASGGVGQYAFGDATKRALLEREGVPIDKLDELARRGVRYIGSKTTNIYCFPTCRDALRIREANLVPFHDEQEAAKKGFRPCKRCQPAAA